MRKLPFGALLGALVILLPGCAEPRDTPEAEIERTLVAGTEAIEAGSLTALAELISDDYRDDRGRDKKALLGAAFVVFKRGPIRLLRLNTDIEAGQQRGSASFTVHALQGREVRETPLDLLPQRARGFRIRLELVWEDGGWRVRNMAGAD